jgi:y4mF family transcriptional regulator
MNLAESVARLRKTAGLTQRELATRAGVGLRFVRDLEQGKPTIRLDKLRQVLDLFGHELHVRPQR